MNINFEIAIRVSVVPRSPSLAGVCLHPGGEGEGSKPLPSFIPFLTEKVPLSHTGFHRKLSRFHIPTKRLFLNFSLEKPLKILG